jgi:hypothetical protein
MFTCMADLAGGAQPGPWYLRAWRTAGAGLTGAAVGAGVAGIWRAGWEAAGTVCRGGPGTVFCIPVWPTVGAVLGSGAVICAGVFAGFLLFQLRPKRLTIPVGCILAAMLIFAVGAGRPGDVPPPTWTAALAAGAGLASLALAVDSGRAQVAGFVAVVIVAAGAFALPHVIRPRTQPDTPEQQLAALGFPLLLPVAAGYHASAASASGGSLSVSMSADTPGGAAFSRRAAFTVGISPVTGPAVKPDEKPDACGSPAPRAQCLELRPGLWLLTDAGAGNGEVITWRGELEVEALSLGYSPVSTSTLVQAATDLRPATAAALAGLGP